MVARSGSRCGMWSARTAVRLAWWQSTRRHSDCQAAGWRVVLPRLEIGADRGHGGARWMAVRNSAPADRPYGSVTSSSEGSGYSCGRPAELGELGVGEERQDAAQPVGLRRSTQVLVERRRHG